MKIEIPIDQIRLNQIKICSSTFIPILDIAIRKSYLNNIEKDYVIEKIDLDSSSIEESIKKGGYYEGSSLELKYSIEDFDIVENDNQKESFIKLYDKENPVRTPVCLYLIEKNKITVKDVTVILAKRYKEILEPISDIDISLDKTSNKNLLWLVNRIIDEDLPEDKISRWIGFIQGVMCVKGYISVNEERNFSRPLFHSVYSNSGIGIPEIKDIIIKGEN